MAVNSQIFFFCFFFLTCLCCQGLHDKHLSLEVKFRFKDNKLYQNPYQQYSQDNVKLLQYTHFFVLTMLLLYSNSHIQNKIYDGRSPQNIITSTIQSSSTFLTTYPKLHGTTHFTGLTLSPLLQRQFIRSAGISYVTRRAIVAGIESPAISQVLTY